MSSFDSHRSQALMSVIDYPILERFWPAYATRTEGYDTDLIKRICLNREWTTEYRQPRCTVDPAFKKVRKMPKLFSCEFDGTVLSGVPLVTTLMNTLTVIFVFKWLLRQAPRKIRKSIDYVVCGDDV